MSVLDSHSNAITGCGSFNDSRFSITNYSFSIPDVVLLYGSTAYGSEACSIGLTLSYFVSLKGFHALD